MSIVSVALSYVGTKENTAKHYHIIDTYNTLNPLPNGYKVTYTDPWCAAFVTACAIEANVINKVYASCNCYDMQTWYKAKQRFTKVARRANIGDYVLYDWDGDGYSDHIGILQKREGNNIYVIEGNKSDAVGVRIIEIGNSNIFGYCKNKLDIAQNDVGDNNESKTDDLDKIALNVIAGKYGNGEARIKNITAMGYDYYTIQQRVNELWDKMYNPRHK